MNDQTTVRLSDYHLRLVQIIFALVVSQSLVIYKDIILHPFLSENYLPFIALLTVYVTTVFSWIDFHRTMVITHYRLQYPSEQWRLGVDLVIVISYAYLLFSIETFDGDAYGIESYLNGFPVVFGLYLLSGMLRVSTYGYVASRRVPILIFLGAYIILILAYDLGWDHIYLDNGAKASEWQIANVADINLVAIAASLYLMILYRWSRGWFKDFYSKRKESGLRIGVDVDGVLGNQIHDMIPRIQKEFGVRIEYNDVTEWNLKIGNSDIAKEIPKAQLDSNFVLKMPVHENAREAMDKIGRSNTVVIVTAREKNTDGWTKQWLDENRIVYDAFINSHETDKSEHPIDVLIDDYIGNIKKVLADNEGSRVAILMDQPWNRNREDLNEWINSGRLKVVQNWSEIPPIIKKLRAEKRKTK